MTVQRRTASHSSSVPHAPPVLHGLPDLETTAELPPLDVEAYEARVGADRLSSTDTWSVPHPEPAAPDPADDSAGQELRVRLESDLKSLSANLRDVEERLGLKGERLNALESELTAVRGSHASAVQRGEALAHELETTRAALGAARTRIEELTQSIAARDSDARAAQSRDSDHLSTLAERERALERAQARIRDLELQVATQLEALQRREGRRGIFEGLLRGLDGEVSASEARCIALQHELDARAQHVRELAAELAERDTRRQALESEVNALAAALAKRDEALSLATRAQDELQASVRTLTELNAQQRERLNTAESELGSHAQAHTEALRTRGDLQRELEAGAASHRERLAALETELAAARALAEERGQALEASRVTALKHLELQEAGSSRAEELESQLAAQELAVRTLHGELRERAERAEIIDADLRAAEDAINRLEAQLRTKSVRIDELVKTGEEWHATVDAARHSLAERDALITRLEGEAANSAALLDNIQHRISVLEPPTLGVDPAPEGATRLLIRTEGEGEGEVVHVLGRKTSVGRTPDNDLQVDTKFISRHHAVILAGPVHTIIEDLNSTNGVLINGRRVTRQTLKDGDAVQIGKTLFRFATRQPSERR